MGIFGRKKEEKKKFDYSDETKEVFAERDAFYSEMRQKMGGNASNPELADQPKTEETKSQIDNLDEILSVQQLDGVYIGPADFSLAYGLKPKFDVIENPVYNNIHEIVRRTK